MVSSTGGRVECIKMNYTYHANNTTNAHKSAFSMYWVHVECPRTVGMRKHIEQRGIDVKLKTNVTCYTFCYMLKIFVNINVTCYTL